MLLDLIRWTKGYVLFSAVGKFPERFINLTIKNGIFIWEMRSKQNKITGKMFMSDYLNIRQIALKTGVKTTILKKTGMPMVIKKYKPRFGLLVGAALFGIIIVILSNQIWTIDINGLETLSYTSVLKTLNENGLTLGQNKSKLNLSHIERQTILKNDKIGWIAINLIGSSATVEIKEKAVKEEPEDADLICNVRALKDGVITSIHTYKGKAAITEGSAVIKGQLLVSSVVEDALGGVTRVHASAKVIAKTYETKEWVQPLENDLMVPTGVLTERFNVQFFNLQFPALPAYITRGEYVRIYSKELIKLSDKVLPAGLIREENIQYENKRFTLNKEQARTALQKRMAMYETLEIPSATVLSKKIKESANKDALIYSVDYVLEENIALEEVVLTQ